MVGRLERLWASAFGLEGERAQATTIEVETHGRESRFVEQRLGQGRPQ